MKVPKWDCHNDEDREAFADFVMIQLDLLDMAEANAPILEGLLDHMNAEARKHEAAEAARAHGLIVGPPPRSRGRPKSPLPRGTAMECAIRDVKRMRGIFRQYWYWGKANRLNRPMREDIAAAYWELTKREKLVLQRRFAKPKRKKSAK